MSRSGPTGTQHTTASAASCSPPASVTWHGRPTRIAVTGASYRIRPGSSRSSVSASTLEPPATLSDSHAS